MTDDELKEYLKYELLSNVIESIGKNINDDSVKELLILNKRNDSELDVGKAIIQQCDSLKSEFIRLTDEYFELLADIMAINNIPPEKRNSYIGNAVNIRVKHDLILNTMLNNIKGNTYLLSKTADVMPSVKSHFDGKQKKNYKDGREERKQESIEYAKNKWKSDHTIRVGTLANEIKLKLKITHTSKAIEGWIKKYKPENKK